MRQVLPAASFLLMALPIAALTAIALQFVHVPTVPEFGALPL